MKKKTYLGAALAVLASTALLSACSPGSSEASTDQEQPPPAVVTRSPKQTSPPPAPSAPDTSGRAPAATAPAGSSGGATAPATVAGTGAADPAAPRASGLPAGRSTGSPPASRTSRSQPPRAPSGTYAPIEYVLMETSLGEIVVELDHERAPVTVENFLGYAERGFYDGTIFHRVIPDFVIQGGGLTPDLQQKETAPPIVNESRNGLRNARGTIAMARLAAPDSATSQFFINVKDNQQLDVPQAPYAVFGKVVSGMDVVDRIRIVETGQKGNRINVPIVDVVVRRVSRISERDAAQRIPPPTAVE